MYEHALANVPYDTFPFLMHYMAGGVGGVPMSIIVWHCSLVIGTLSLKQTHPSTVLQPLVPENARRASFSDQGTIT